MRIEILAKYGYLARVRDLCKQIAQDRGFDEDEAFDIALSMDEILNNAFQYGCKHPSDDRIDIKMSFAGRAVFVAIRDPGGNEFDYHKYKTFKPRSDDEIASGLYLVNKFADGWVVNTEPGEYTEVMFFKKKKEDKE